MTRLKNKQSLLGILFVVTFLSLVQADDDVPEDIQSLPILDTFLNFEENFNKSADRTSQKALTAPTTESVTGAPRISEIPKQRYAIAIPSGDRKKEIEAIRAHLIAKTDEYLAWHREKRPSPGLHLVKPEHLNLQLLKTFRRPQSNNPHRKEFVLVFDDQFHQHVRSKGLQLELSKTGRFSVMAYVGVGGFAALLLTYGVLKLINGRAKHEDYLSNSQISMV